MPTQWDEGLLRNNPAFLQMLQGPARATGYDPALAATQRADFGGQARAIGMGQLNQFLRLLQQRGLGRSGAALSAPGAAAGAQAQALRRLTLPFALHEQPFKEGQRQFNTGAFLRALAMKQQERQIDYSKPPKFALDTPFGGISF